MMLIPSNPPSQLRGPHMLHWPLIVPEHEKACLEGQEISSEQAPKSFLGAGYSEGSAYRIGWPLPWCFVSTVGASEGTGVQGLRRSLRYHNGWTKGIRAVGYYSKEYSVFVLYYYPIGYVLLLIILVYYIKKSHYRSTCIDQANQLPAARSGDSTKPAGVLDGVFFKPALVKLKVVLLALIATAIVASMSWYSRDRVFGWYDDKGQYLPVVCDYTSPLDVWLAQQSVPSGIAAVYYPRTIRPSRFGSWLGWPWVWLETLEIEGGPFAGEVRRVLCVDEYILFPARPERADSPRIFAIGINVTSIGYFIILYATVLSMSLCVSMFIGTSRAFLRTRRCECYWCGFAQN